MNKVKLNILGLSNSQSQTGAYALLLAEEKGERRLPIIIGAFEAQSIALQLEGLTPPRPLTHDLFHNFASAFEIVINEVNIFKLDEGVFYSVLICQHENSVINIDARTSDAVALALRFNCPIYTTENILKKAGVFLDADNELKGEDEKELETETLTGSKWGKYSAEELEELLKEAIENEDYEKASEIRDEINKKN